MSAADAGLSKTDARQSKKVGVPRCKFCASTALTPRTEKHSQCDQCFSVGRPVMSDAEQTTCLICMEPPKKEKPVGHCTRCFLFVCRGCFASGQRTIGKVVCPGCRGDGFAMGRRKDIRLDLLTPPATHAAYKTLAVILRESPESSIGHVVISDHLAEYHRWLVAISTVEDHSLGTLAPHNNIYHIWQQHMRHPTGYEQVCKAICGRLIDHLPLMPAGDIGEAKERAKKLMQEAPGYTSRSRFFWGARDCDSPSVAFTLAPVGEIMVKGLGAVTFLGPYHPKYTGRDLQLKFELKEQPLRTKKGVDVDIGRTLEAQGITTDDMLYVVGVVGVAIDPPLKRGDDGDGAVSPGPALSEIDDGYPKLVSGLDDLRSAINSCGEPQVEADQLATN